MKAKLLGYTNCLIVRSYTLVPEFSSCSPSRHTWGTTLTHVMHLHGILRVTPHFQSLTDMTFSPGQESTLRHKEARRWASQSWDYFNIFRIISMRSCAQWLRAQAFVTDRTWLHILVLILSSYVTLSKFIYLSESQFSWTGDNTHLIGSP